jgi:pimeloyl-ACP methyl ester carboxylesterase
MLRLTTPTMLLALLLLTVSGCTDFFSKGKTLGPQTTDAQFSGDVFQTLYGNGPGEACDFDGECRIGLKCVESICAVVGEGESGSLCILSDDCEDGLVCSFDTEHLDQPKTCVPQGDGEQWDTCTTDKDCQKGFYCQLLSFTGTCQPAGDGDVGIECEDTGDCVAGLYCGVDGRCGIMGAQVPLFTGEECEPSSVIGGTPRVLFEVPRKGQPLKDFYRLPFPNDIRVVDGKLNLAGHPSPGPGAVGYDIAARVISAMEEDLSAFGTNPVIYFRFSQTPDLNSIQTGENPNVLLVDITDAMQAGYGKKQSISWVASTGRGLYICQNYLAVYVPWARPLAGGRTYAVMVTNGLLTDPGDEAETDPGPFAADTDFLAMIGDAAPADKDLKTAWDKYAPLRDFLETQQAGNLGVSSNNLIGATVFTTYSPDGRLAKFKEEMDTIALPEIVDAVVCDVGTVSPCDDGLTGEEHRRGCMSVSPDFVEVQGLIKFPVFQVGDKPYIEPKDGGGIEFDALGRPVVQGFEEVCFSLTLPHGTPPATGWPVVLYGHGTGGDYRSHITTGIAARLSKFMVWNQDTEASDREVKAAVFGWDQVMHGPRVGPAPLDPDSLVFNFRNPRAALGNFSQAAAETMVLARTLAEWNSHAPDIADAQDILSPDQVLFFGHSQGGISGPLAIPFVDAVDAMVISGTGGGLLESLLRKTAPVNVKDGVIVALQDENVGRTHPVLALIQQYYDAVDPINYGEKLFYSPVQGHKVYTFHPIGLTDLHTPSKTMKGLSQAMRAMLTKAPSLAEEDYEPFGGVQQVELPYSVSGVLTVEYGLPPDDGHFVVFQNEDAIRHTNNFIGSAFLDGKPYVIK